MRKKETAAGVKKDDDTSVAAIVAKKDDDTSKAAAAVKLDVDSAGGSTEMAGARLMEPANLAVQSPPTAAAISWEPSATSPRRSASIPMTRKPTISAATSGMN
jgi:hypothetical protein